MPIVSHSLKLLYAPVPKNACTSIKTLLWNLEHDGPFVPFEDKRRKYRHIHDYYDSSYFSADMARKIAPSVRGYFKFAVVREPTERLVSCYRNRVIFHRELSPNALEQAQIRSPRLVSDPDINHFVKHLPLYRVASKAIAHHTDPQTKFIGASFKFFDHVYKFEELSELEEVLSGRLHARVRLERLQSHGPPASEFKLSTESQEALYTYYEQDYLMLRGRYC